MTHSFTNSQPNTFPCPKATPVKSTKRMMLGLSVAAVLMPFLFYISQFLFISFLLSFRFVFVVCFFFCQMFRFYPNLICHFDRLFRHYVSSSHKEPVFGFLLITVYLDVFSFLTGRFHCFVSSNSLESIWRPASLFT